MHTIKPLDSAALLQAAAQTRGVVTVEDHLVTGGLGSAVCEVLAARHPCRVHRIGVRDGYSDLVGDEEYLLEATGVSVDTIAATARSLVAASG
jgi:transketolase